MEIISNPQDVSHWMMHRKKYYYFAQFLGPFLPGGVAIAVLLSNNGDWFWFTVLTFYFGSAILDLITGKDHNNVSIQEDEQQLINDKFYNTILTILVPLYIIAFALTAYAVVSVNISWLQFFVAAIGVGAMFAGVFCVGHELGHRKQPQQRFWARVAVSMYGYAHFHIEHNRGHHVHVATPEDAASARMGENVYQFMAREIPNTFKRAIELETERLARINTPFWSTSNEILQGYAITFTLYLFIIMLVGTAIIPFLILTTILGFFQLTMANYLEHYGLLRKKLDNGRYEKCQPHHSWNSNHLFTNALTLQLQRHSDHHANASRHFQVLLDYDQVPQLPAGYPFMQFLSVFPPLWRWVMDRQLLEFVNYDMNKVNSCPKKREQLFNKYHRQEA